MKCQSLISWKKKNKKKKQKKKKKKKKKRKNKKTKKTKNKKKKKQKKQTNKQTNKQKQQQQTIRPESDKDQEMEDFDIIDDDIVFLKMTYLLRFVYFFQKELGVDSFGKRV